MLSQNGQVGQATRVATACSSETFTQLDLAWQDRHLHFFAGSVVISLQLRSQRIERYLAQIIALHESQQELQEPE
jgi:hypothetical protein